MNRSADERKKLSASDRLTFLKRLIVVAVMKRDMHQNQSITRNARVSPSHRALRVDVYHHRHEIIFFFNISETTRDSNGSIDFTKVYILVRRIQVLHFPLCKPLDIFAL